MAPRLFAGDALPLGVLRALQALAAVELAAAFDSVEENKRVDNPTMILLKNTESGYVIVRFW